MAQIMSILISALIIFALTISCAEDSVVSPPAIVPITVAFGDTATVTSQGASITFARIFLCQEDFYCQWEGGAEVLLKVRIPSDTAEHRVLLPILRGADHTKSETLMPVDALGFRFTLLELSPYPRPTNDSEYVATIEMFAYDLPDTLDGRLTISDISPQDIKLNGFWLDTAYIENDRIHLTAKYGGGCLTHYFWL